MIGEEVIVNWGGAGSVKFDRFGVGIGEVGVGEEISDLAETVPAHLLPPEVEPAQRAGLQLHRIGLNVSLTPAEQRLGSSEAPELCKLVGGRVRVFVPRCRYQRSLVLRNLSD